MSRIAYRGDAPDVAQVTLIPTPPTSFSGTIKIMVSNKSLEFTSWDAAAIAAAWNGATAAEYQIATAAVVTDGVQLTAATAGVPFVVTVNYGDGATFDEIVLINKSGFSGTVSGTVDVTFDGQTDTLAYDFDAADLLSALEGLSNIDPGDVVCEDVSSTQIKVTFGGQYADIDAPSLTIDDSNLDGGSASVVISKTRDYSAAQNEKQKIVIGGAPTGGTVTYDLDGTEIGPLAYNANEATYQAAFDSALGSGNSDVTFLSQTGDAGPEQKKFPTVAADTDDGFVESTNFDDTNDLVLGNVNGNLSTLFIRCSFPVSSLPGNVVLERAYIGLNRKSSDANANISATISAVDQAAPATISDASDLSSRPKTTAEVSATILPSTLSPGKSLVDIAPIIQELLDTHGALDELVLLIEAETGSLGSITYHDYSSAVAADLDPPTLTVVYRDGSSGATSIEVELIGTNAATSFPLMTVADNSLTPGAGNTKWRIEIVADTGAPDGTVGYAQLYSGLTLIAASNENGSYYSFQTAVGAILDDYLGPGNYTLTESAEAVGRWDVELVEQLAGETNLPDDLVLYWTPVDNNPYEYDDPVVSIETITEGGTGVGEIQEITANSAPASGEYAIRIDDQTTSTLDFADSMATIKTALEALSNVGSGKVVSVTGSWATSIVVEFDVSLGDVELMEILSPDTGFDIRIVSHSEYQTNATQTQTNFSFYGTKNFTSVGIECSSGDTATITSVGGGWETDIATQIEAMLNLFYPEASSITVTANSGNIPGLGFGVQAEVITTSSIAYMGENPATNDFEIYRIENTTSGGTLLWYSNTTIQQTGTAVSGSWELNIFVDGVLVQTLNLAPLDQLTNIDQTIQNAIETFTTDATVTSTSISSSEGPAEAIQVSAVEKVTFTVGIGTIEGSGEITVETTREATVSPNEIQRITVDNYPNIGGGYIAIQWPPTGEVQYWYGPPLTTQELTNQLEELLGNTTDFRVTDAGGSSGQRKWDIEFIGTLASTALDQMVLTNGLQTIDPDPEDYETAIWALIQEGGNGGIVTISEIQDGSGALGAKYRLSLSGSPHRGTFTLTLNAETTAALDYDATAAEIQTAVIALASVSSGDVTALGNLTSGVALDFLPGFGAAALTGSNVDLTNARITATESTKGGGRFAQELTRSAGKNHFDDPLNWKVLDTGESRIPDSADEIIFENGAVGCLYGLRQRTTFSIVDSVIVAGNRPDFRVGQIVYVSSSDTLPSPLSAATAYEIETFDRDTNQIGLKTGGGSVTITDAGTGTHTIRLAADSLLHHSRFTGAIGLPFTNAAGYREYLPVFLELGFLSSGEKLLKIGEGGGSSSGRLRFDLGADETTIEVHNTGGSIETSVPALVINGTNDANAFEQFDGDSGLGFFEGDEFQFATLRIHAGTMFYGKIVSAASAVFRNLGGSIDGREGQITGKISSKP